jgi:hypothetical protein
MIIKKIFDFIRKNLHLLDKMTRHQATGILEWEKSELENIFSLLIFGSFIGMPGTPTQITLELLPYMEKELIQMVNKVQTASGPVSELFSNLNVS